jgi:hypothetical protein
VSDPGVDHTVIVPTCGRPTLERTLWSIAVSAGPDSSDVEALVVADGPQPDAHAIFERFGEAHPTWRYLEYGPTARRGNAQRTYGMTQARGQHLLFMDDDDVYRRRAFKAIRAATAQTPTRPRRPLQDGLERLGALGTAPAREGQTSVRRSSSCRTSRGSLAAGLKRTGEVPITTSSRGRSGSKDLPCGARR